MADVGHSCVLWCRSLWCTCSSGTVCPKPAQSSRALHKSTARQVLVRYYSRQLHVLHHGLLLQHYSCRHCYIVYDCASARTQGTQISGQGHSLRGMPTAASPAHARMAAHNECALSISRHTFTECVIQGRGRCPGRWCWCAARAAWCPRQRGADPRGHRRAHRESPRPLTRAAAQWRRGPPRH
jgi:hypothetical protein